VTITATDGLGASTTATFDLVVNNVAPAFTAGVDGVVYRGPRGGIFSRTITFTDPGTDVWSGRVNWGDGTSEALVINETEKCFDLKHAYMGDGTYAVVVTLYDSDGGVCTDTALTHVHARPPMISVTSPRMVQWQQSVGRINMDFLSWLQETSDGGFVLGVSPDGGYCDFRVVRLDAYGHKLWDRSFGGYSDDLLNSVRQMSDGGFILGGCSESIAGSGNKTSPRYGYSDFWVVRLNADGSMLWDKSFGGCGRDYLDCLQLTSDDGFVLSGYSESTAGSGNKSSWGYGNADFWVVRIDGTGNILWDKSFGGVECDRPYCLEQTSDGGFIVGGVSFSPEGTGNKMSPHYGASDYWVVRLDAAGNSVWDGSFGGSSDDCLYCVQQTGDGGYILSGSSFSSTGTGNKSSMFYGGDRRGSGDSWVVRLDSEGNMLWDKSFGGSDDDHLDCLQQTSDGGFILGGYSCSASGTGNKTSPKYGCSDFWVVRLNAEGNMLWDKSFGGSDVDHLDCLQQTSDGGFIIGGYSCSASGTGNKTSPNYGSSDFWVIRLDADGNMLWDKSFGGSSNDLLHSLQQTGGGGLILAGESLSAAGTGNKISPNYGGFDAWLVRLPSEVLVDEGQAANVMGTFSDPDPADTVTISASIGTISQVGAQCGTWNWFCTPADGPDQSQTVMITATDATGAISTVMFDLVVNNVVPVLDAGADAVVHMEPSGSAAFGREVTFTDPGTDVWSGTVNWGDGSADEPVDIDRPTKSFSVNHTYTAYGTYSVTVVVSDDDGGIGTSGFNVRLALLLSVESTPVIGVGITGDRPGITNYNAACDYGETVSLTAPPRVTTDDGVYKFLWWELDSSAQPHEQDTLHVTMETSHEATAHYGLDCDVNGDCRVNVLDLILVRNKLGQDASTGDNWKVDVNGDGRINVLDLITARNNLGKNCP